MNEKEQFDLSMELLCAHIDNVEYVLQSDFNPCLKAKAIISSKEIYVRMYGEIIRDKNKKALDTFQAHEKIKKLMKEESINKHL